METIQEIIAGHGGMEKLSELAPLRVDIDSDNYLLIEDAGLSPKRFPAVGIAFFNNPTGKGWHSWMVFEITASGWQPYFLKTRLGDVRHVYRVNHRGRIEQVRRRVRGDLTRIAQQWNAELEILLAGGEVSLT